MPPHSDLTRVTAMLALCLWLPAAQAAAANEPPQLTLQASAEQEVVQDTAYVRFQVISEGSSAAAAMQDANQRLNRAMQLLKAEPAFEVQSEGYNTQPRYQRDGKISGWQVSAGIRVASRDMPRLADSIARIAPHANLDGLWFGLSRKRQQETEQQLLNQAIENLQHKAAVAAQAAGYNRTELRSLDLQGDSSPPPMPLLARAKGMMLEAATAPQLEAGKQTVRVTVSGSLWMLK